MRVQFNQVFHQNPDESLSPLRQIRVGGVSFGPGVTFGSGVAFGGVNFSQYQGHDLEIEEREGIIIIKGIY